MLTTILALLQLVPAAPMVDGQRLFVGDSCYVTSGSDPSALPAGKVLRRVERIARDRLMITVAARFNGGPLMTSRLKVAFPDLHPIETREDTDGRISLVVRYRDGLAGGKIYSEDGDSRASTKMLGGPVWDDETLEFVLTTLPFAQGAHFDLPVFQFDRGPAVSRIDVTGTRTVDIDGASREAWVVSATTRSDMIITFLVGKSDRRLLEVDVGGVRSYLGGNCAELSK